MKKLFFLMVIFAGFVSINQLNSASTFFDVDKIQKIEIYFSQPNWDYQLDTAKVGGFETTIMADWIKINGIKFDSVGVRYKGNSSFDSTYKKNPFNIALDQYKSQSHEGYKTIKLANIFSDPSMIREILSYHIAFTYMDSPKANFAQVYINGELIGLYSNTETINKTYCTERYFTNNNTFISCTPMVTPGPTVKSNFKYINGDSTSYYNYYELKSKFGWKDLMNLCDTVTNYPDAIDKIFDIDRVLWMLAFDNVMVNLDSYIGAFAQNHYIYRDKSGLYNMSLWDLNMSLGGFPYIGSSNTSMGQMSITELENLSLTIHSKDKYWPLLNAVNGNASFKKRYIAHAKTIVNEFFSNDEYINYSKYLQKLIDTAVISDKNKFYSYQDFQNGLTSDVKIGSYTVPGIQNLMSKRTIFLNSSNEFNASEPSIESIKVASSSPSINSSNVITAKVNNTITSSVYLGIRFSKKDKFKKYQMFDDGIHNDGLANDNIYGISFKMDSVDAQYYIYAENDNAGKFAPARAEHEFYLISTSITGVDEESSNIDISIYPNPANDFIEITISQLKEEKEENYNIYNALGEMILTHLTSSQEGKLRIDVSNLSAGVYYMKMGNRFEKFVKI
jgi:hypothetical protein